MSRPFYSWIAWASILSVLAPSESAFASDLDGRIVESAKQRFRIEVVARGLDTPWGLAFLPDGRLLVTERPGRLRIVEKGKLSPEPVKGIPKVWVRQDGGLMDIAAHPDFARNGWLYLSYSDALSGDAEAPSPPSMTVIVRGRVNRRNEWVDAQEIFRAPVDAYTVNNSHYGSRLIFDKEGHLFYSLGDRGVFANAQDLTNALGKIHRVNSDGTIPRDNPFAKQTGVMRSIWSYGHRNPQGLSWDPSTGLLWESEHGPGGGDEINIVERAKNYGWGVATMGVQQGMTTGSAPGTEAPVIHYTPRIAPSGIAFYNGNRYSGWRNNLFVAGLAGQQLRRLEISGRKVVGQEVVLEKTGRIRAVTTGPDGLLYILVQNATGTRTGIELTASTPGMVVRLVPIS